jgi:hypothetical protein
MSIIDYVKYRAAVQSSHAVVRGVATTAQPDVHSATR